MTPSIRRLILDRLINGESLMQICSDESMPSRSTVRRYFQGTTREHVEFLERCDQILRVRELMLLDEMMDVGDDNQDDWMEVRNDKGEPYIALNRENITRARLKSKAIQGELRRIERERASLMRYLQLPPPIHYCPWARSPETAGAPR